MNGKILSRWENLKIHSGSSSAQEQFTNWKSSRSSLMIENQFYIDD